MINTSKDKPVFIETGEQLNASIIAALKLASKWVLQYYGLETINLRSVNTKSFKEAILPALVKEFILSKSDTVFHEGYVLDVFELVSVDFGDCSPDLYNRLTVGNTYGKWEYRKSYLPSLRRGLGVFLVALHIRRAIVLPFSFKWPIGIERDEARRVIRRREICPPEELPELLRFFRALESQGEIQTEAVFNQYSMKQRERLASVGQRLVVAAGWLIPEDANYDDMLALFEANEQKPLSGTPNLGCLMLADLFERKYHSSSPINAVGWRTHLSNSRDLFQSEIFAGSIERNEDILLRAITVQPSQMTPEALAQQTHLPGLDFDLNNRTKIWLAIETAWLKKVKHESNKDRLLAIGYLNIYLFAYLPYWFEIHPEFSYEFPDAPNKLIGAVFVSDLGLLGNLDKPVSLVEFFDEAAKHRKWENPTHYSVLKQIEKLFSFIERVGSQMPECAGFQQPLSEHDYPLLARSYGTNKRPIPRRIFKFALGYIEAIASHAEVLLSRIVAGEVSDCEIGFLKQDKSTTIDTFEQQDLFGFIPIVFHKGKVIPLRRIPNVLFIYRKAVVGGRVLKIPHPHALHQIIVSLYTGLRHNHIQWLDARTFDKEVETDKGRLEYAKLHVNTDKTKTEPWESHVNFRVIEILRAQLAWRNLIAEPGFTSKVFYNNNEDTKWGEILPLFAYFSDGRPHNDNLYAAAWVSLLAGVQGVLGEIGESGLHFVKLLPTCVPFDCPDQAELLFQFGSQQTRRCQLVLKSDITPHSARVSVVSHSISILPADMIGRYWTGQKEATVYHYVVPDEDEIYIEQQRQGLALRQRGYEDGYEAMLSDFPIDKNNFIKADDVNSRLSKSLKLNVEETILAYGCVSLSLNGNQKTGLDILRETRASGAAENKTEICPYGNQCPAEVVIALKGFRRCGPCQFAVRSIDHLPAITAKIRQVLEGLTEIEARLDASEVVELSSNEWDALADNRSILAEDLAAWQMAAEVLEVMRQRVAAGDSAKTWHIQRPEIIERHLKRTLFPTNTTEYVLARLHESEVFPLLESPQIRAKFEMLRRNLLANVGNIREALRLEQPINPSVECLGLIRSIARSNQLGMDDLRKILETDEIGAFPSRALRVLQKDGLE